MSHSLSAFVIGFALAVPDPVPEPKPESYYPLAVGTEWHFVATQKSGPGDEGRTVKIMMRAAEQEEINGVMLVRLETVIDGKVAASEHLQVSDKGVFRHRFNGMKAEPPFHVLRFPINKKDSWPNKLTIGGGKLESTSTLTEEEVTVPQGKHKALKLVVDGDANGLKLKTTFWFAPNVGLVQQTLSMPDLYLVLKLEKYVPAKGK